MRIVVLGAGAMGCLFGGYLSRSNEVILIDSYAPQVNAINENGICVEELNGCNIHFSNVKAYESGTYKNHADLVIVFVKSNYTEDALSVNKSLFADDTVVLTLQNGAGNDRKIARYVRPENIIIGTTKHNCLNKGGGLVKHTGSGTTSLGTNSEKKDALQKVYKAFFDSEIETVVSDDIQRIIWSKLFINLSVNTFTAITKTPIGFMYADRNAWRFAKRLVYEAIEVAEEDGTYFDRHEVLESLKKLCLDCPKGYSSMYQDMIHKRKTEIDAINGAIVEQAKQYGVPTPYNSMIVDLIHAMEGAYEIKD